MTTLTAAAPSLPTLHHHHAGPPSNTATSTTNLNTTTTTTPATSKRAAANNTGSVTATLNFYAPPTDGSRPHNYVEPPTDGRPQRNFGSAPTSVALGDARGHEADFSLAADAFACLLPAAASSDATDAAADASIDWDDDASVRATYYPAVTRLLLATVPGAKRVILFDHTVRRASPSAHRAPVTRVHVDQTAASTAERVRRHVGEACSAAASAPFCSPAFGSGEDTSAAVAAALAGRYRIINIWRPINGTVESFPLAFASARSVSDADMVPVEHRYPTHTGETAAVKHGAGQRWWYWGGMRTDERLLLQCADSKDWGCCVPHSAFVDPRSGDEARPRESCEVRALVLG